MDTIALAKLAERLYRLEADVAAQRHVPPSGGGWVPGGEGGADTIALGVGDFKMRGAIADHTIMEKYEWLLCDGRAVARAGDYAPLFAIIDIAFGAGDGTTTFNLPDFTKQNIGGYNFPVFPVGAGGGGQLPALGEKGGDPRHTHPFAGETGATQVQVSGEGTAYMQSGGGAPYVALDENGVQVSAVDHVHPVGVTCQETPPGHAHPVSGGTDPTPQNAPDVLTPFLGVGFFILAKII